MTENKLPDDALEFFRQKGLEGAKKRAEQLTPERRTKIAKKAARARWRKKPEKSS